MCDEVWKERFRTLLHDRGCIDDNFGGNKQNCSPVVIWLVRAKPSIYQFCEQILDLLNSQFSGNKSGPKIETWSWSRSGSARRPTEICEDLKENGQPNL